MELFMVVMSIKENTMKVDENATKYEDGNGRFDLMTDEEVRTWSADDFQSILVRLAHLVREGQENSIGEEIYHRLYELHLRYNDVVFRLEVLPSMTEEQEVKGE
jgi:hypothetical protein